MKFVFSQLSEKDRRLYAGLETQKLPRGGQNYIADLFDCSPKTIRRGEKELEDKKLLPAKDRIRHKGGGRKRILDEHLELNEMFEQALEENTAGNPMNEEIRWTNLTPNQIAEKISTEGHSVSAYTVKQLLKKNKFKKRKARKSLSLGTSLFRDEQFKNIATLKKDYFAAGLPIISIDTKKKELLGNLYRDGHLYTKEVIRVYDHDFPYLADGVVIPYTIYDIRHNRAYVYLGTSKDTAEFVSNCENWDFQHKGVPADLPLSDSFSTSLGPLLKPGIAIGAKQRQHYPELKRNRNVRHRGLQSGGIIQTKCRQCRHFNGDQNCVNMACQIVARRYSVCQQSVE